MSTKTMGNMKLNTTVKKHDWTMFAGGIAVALLGLVVMFWPGATLLTLATAAGVFLAFAGIVEIVGYFTYKNTGLVSGWQVAGGILNLLLAAIFLLNPFITAAMFPWLAGIATICYGVFSLAGGISMKDSLPGVWGWLAANGVIAILCGILFMVYPASFVIFLGVFLICRGITMVVYGLTTPKVETTVSYSNNDE